MADPTGDAHAQEREALRDTVRTLLERTWAKPTYAG